MHPTKALLVVFIIFSVFLIYRMSSVNDVTKIMENSDSADNSESTMLPINPSTAISSKDLYIVIRDIRNYQNIEQWLKQFDAETNNDTKCKECLVIVSEDNISIDGFDGKIREILSHPAGRSIATYTNLNNGYVLTIRYGTENPSKLFPESKRKAFDALIPLLKINPSEIIINKVLLLPDGSPVEVYQAD